ncbi:hypothetical protein BMS3Bbin13_01050 [bacterium BMS3Bbin13]|nr:hypothetical protein BMS3Bbin13_01050 [bacterium BMS3Bbin13]
MAADLRLIAHAAERHAYELAARRARDRAPERGLADAGGADQAQNRSLQLAHALLHREILDDAFLHLLEPVVVLLQHLLGGAEVVADLGALLPRHVHQPLDVVADYGRLRRHRGHEAQLVQLPDGLGLDVLRHAGLFDLLGEVLQFVGGVLQLAEFLLNGLHLLVQVVLALALLHLLFDARANALLDLEDVDLRLDQAHEMFEPLTHADDLEDVLLLLEFECHVRGDGVGEPARIVDTRQRGEDLRRDLLVEFDVLVELPHDGAHQHLDLTILLGCRLLADRHAGREIFL